MYKVLLADDEILDLEGMKRFIPWESLGMSVVDSVNNGFAAYEVLEKEDIDILVTDIRMPNMTGLELAQKAIEIQEDIRVIFVSGYEDFGYVKQAIALNACSYVLKPMDDQELIEALHKVRRELDKSKEHQLTELAYKQMVPLVKNQYLLQLLEKPYEAVPLEVLNKEYKLNEIAWPVCVALLEIDDVSWKLNQLDEADQEDVVDLFFSQLHRLLAEQNIDYVCKVSDYRMAMLLDEKNEKAIASRILEQLKDEFPFTVTVGLSSPVSRLMDLHPSYREAVSALDHKMFYGKGRWIPYADVPSEDIKDAENLYIRLDSLLSAMTNYELVRIHDELEELLLLASSLRSKFTIQNFAMYIVLKLDDHLHNNNENLFKISGMELKNLDILLQFETIDDIFSWLRRLVFEISEQLHNKKQSKNGRLIQEIIEDVSSRLHENITLRDIANRFSFSPNYLGLLFKEETGHNFSDYVIAMRMEKARDLLRNTKLKIYEIASQTGYQYLPYFSRQFKETYGMTPLEYRRKFS
ncbi:response regulator [Paenibacillus faecalis]|uniref:response regulator n=1 Tax=Paenibacillus faecalis TaxID=2079532 RepID=UPI000D10DFA8|nr:response regulator [Paenibacillus faecalis]